MALSANFALMFIFSRPQVKTKKKKTAGEKSSSPKDEDNFSFPVRKNKKHT